MATTQKLSAWRRRPPLSIVMAYFASHASDHAAGLAFNAFLSMFPLMLGLIALVGLFPQSDDIKGAVEDVPVKTLPPSEQAGMLRTFQHAKTSAGALAVFSLLALVWSGTNLFSSMEFALNQIYICGSRPFWRTRVMGVVMLAVYRRVGSRRCRSGSARTPSTRTGWCRSTAAPATRKPPKRRPTSWRAGKFAASRPARSVEARPPAPFPPRP